MDIFSFADFQLLFSHAFHIDKTSPECIASTFLLCIKCFIRMLPEGGSIITPSSPPGDIDCMHPPQCGSIRQCNVLLSPLRSIICHVWHLVEKLSTDWQQGNSVNLSIKNAFSGILVGYSDPILGLQQSTKICDQHRLLGV